MSENKEKAQQNRIKIEPMIPMDYPDPDVIRVDDTYVMVSTTMHFFPGGPILYSKDLVNWKIASYLFDTLDDSPAERLEGNENIYGHGMWAPTLRYHDGKYYVAFVSHKSDNKPPEFMFDPIMGMRMSEGEEEETEGFTHLFISSSIFGPWEHRIIAGYYHDCSLLFDDDGRNYIIYGNTEIRITELKPDLSGPLEGGLDRVLVKDNGDEMILCYEGSHFYKINGKYYLALIHWPISTGRRTQAVYMSDSLTGTFTGKDVLSEGSYFNQGIAQGGFFDTADGEWYSIMFRDSGAVGRMPILCRLEWEGDFPVFDIEGKVPLGYMKQYSGRNEKDNEDDLICSANFTTEGSITYELAYAWQWNHKPSYGLWHLEDSKTMSITTGKIAANPTMAQNIPTQRMIYPACCSKVTVDVSGLNDGDYAGLLVLQGNYAMVGIKKERGIFYLVTVVNERSINPGIIGSSDIDEGEIAIGEEISDNKIDLMVYADFTDMNDKMQMFYKEEDGKWTQAGKEHKLHFGLDHFTGARVGLCVYSTKETGGTAVFSNFSIGVEKDVVDSKEIMLIKSGESSIVKKEKYERLRKYRKNLLQKFAFPAYINTSERGIIPYKSWVVVFLTTMFIIFELAIFNVAGGFTWLFLIITIGIFIVYFGPVFITRYGTKLQVIPNDILDRYDRFFTLIENGTSKNLIDEEFDDIVEFMLKRYESMRMIKRNISIDVETEVEVISYIVSMRMSDDRQNLMLEYIDDRKKRGQKLFAELDKKK